MEQCDTGGTIRAEEDSVAAVVEANEKLMGELTPWVKLLNGLSDENAPWQACFGRNDYRDAFGVLIAAGINHYRKGMPTTSFEPLRLSATSMQRVIQVLFEANRAGMSLAERVNKERFERMRQACAEAQTPLA